MELEFKFKKEEAELILMGLGELPAKISMNRISKIQIEAQKQLSIPKEETKEQIE